jgi:hypothetical protein
VTHPAVVEDRVVGGVLLPGGVQRAGAEHEAFAWCVHRLGAGAEGGERPGQMRGVCEPSAGPQALGGGGETAGVNLLGVALGEGAAAGRPRRLPAGGGPADR